MVILRLDDDSNIILKYDDKLIFDFDKYIGDNLYVNNLIQKKNTLNKLSELIEYLDYKKETHGSSKKYFNNKNFCFIIPSIIITAIISILSFLVSSSYVDNDASDYLSIAVGIFGVLATFLQSFSSAVNYNGKSEAHSIAYEEYDNIYTNISFELDNPRESIDDPDNFYSNIRNSIIDIKKKCNYIVPDHIEKKYFNNKLNKKMLILKNKTLETAMKIKVDRINNSIIEKTKTNIDLNNLKDDLTFNLV